VSTDSQRTPDPRSFQQTEQFASLLTRNQRRLYLFILALLPNPVDAEELLQETSIVLWRKFDQFQSGTDFLAWACQVARYEVLKFYQRRQRAPAWHQIPDDVLHELAKSSLQCLDEFEARRAALAGCLERLSRRDRDLIERRWRPGATIGQIAAELGRPLWGLYKVYQRIHRDLFDCIERTLVRESRE
jgi:RNA polymerase sigma-70 factor, ECF subfamily